MGRKVVRVGMIGCGFQGRTHSEVITKYVPNAELVAVAGGSRAPSLAREYGVIAEKSVDLLLSRDDIDAVFINTPHSSHAEYTVLAAESGKHVYVEKPMATTVEDCDRMINACRRAGVKLMVGYTQRYRSCNAIAKRLIDEGEIGRILMIQKVHLLADGIKLTPKWQSLPENVGTLIGHGIHSIDMILWWINGWGKLKSIFAKSGAFRIKSDVELSSMILMTFKNDVAATLWCSYECPPPGFPASNFRAYIMGDKGLLDVDGYGKLQLGINDKWETVYVQPKIDWSSPEGMLSKVRLESFTKCDQEFINSIVEDREPAAPGEQGREGVKIALLAYESSRLGKTLTL